MNLYNKSIYTIRYFVRLLFFTCFHCTKIRLKSNKLQVVEGMKLTILINTKRTLSKANYFNKKQTPVTHPYSQTGKCKNIHMRLFSASTSCEVPLADRTSMSGHWAKTVGHAWHWEATWVSQTADLAFLAPYFMVCLAQLQVGASE